MLLHTVEVVARCVAFEGKGGLEAEVELEVALEAGVERSGLEVGVGIGVGVGVVPFITGMGSIGPGLSSISCSSSSTPFSTCKVYECISV